MRGTLKERLLAKTTVNPETGCWLWQGNTHPKGYGYIRKGPASAGSLLVHRASYELFNGPIPDGLEIDHKCKVRHCLNPDHLEAVSHHENIRRGAYANKTHCKHGHEFTPENIYSINGRHRSCRECTRIAGRAYAAKKRAARWEAEEAA